MLFKNGDDLIQWPLSATKSDFFDNPTSYVANFWASFKTSKRNMRKSCMSCPKIGNKTGWVIKKVTFSKTPVKSY